MSAARDAERPGLLERLGDRLNPILVKEVRQALRGRYFRVSFALTLLAASVNSLAWLVFQSFERGADEALGPGFYTINFACIVVATHGLVPFYAFVSMGSEWDENTYDLLVLSNLRPRQIVLGKVLSAGVQALLFYSAFGPFLVFAFLLRGVDLLVLLVSLAGSLITSFSLACLAVALSSLARQRFLRITLMGLLAAFLIVGAIAPAIGSASMFMHAPGELRQPEALPAIGGLFSSILAAGVLFLLIASSRLAHPEENRSTGLRVYAAAMPLLLLGWISLMSAYYLQVPLEPTLVSVLLCQAFLALAALFFTTEPERLGRRVRRQVPRSRALALFSAPFLPGGGRGLLWFLVANALVIGWFLLQCRVELARDPGWTGPTATQQQVPFVAAGIALLDLGLVSLAASAFTRSAWARVAARVGVLALFVGAIVLPALVGFFLERPRWMSFEHPLNPLVLLYRLFTDRAKEVGDAPMVLGIAVLFVLAANGLRLVRAVSEPWKAHAHPAPAPLAPRVAEERAS